MYGLASVESRPPSPDFCEQELAAPFLWFWPCRWQRLHPLRTRPPNPPPNPRLPRPRQAIRKLRAVTAWVSRVAVS
jgi:hypothetical protein